MDETVDASQTMIPLLLQRIAGKRLLVVGDVMIDRYWYGDVDRISPEAPVPVASIRRAEERPGGAANVAGNVTTLGASARLCSVTGDDHDADALARLLATLGVDAQFVRDKLINTTVKLRVISRNQQMIRIDFDSPGSHDARVKLLDQFLMKLKEPVDAAIISDYGKGGLGHVAEMIEAARKTGVPVVVDPKGDDFSVYRGATLLTPNRREFEHVVGRVRDEMDLEQKAAAMVAALELQGLLVTRGADGMSYIGREGEIVHVPARAREVYDVTGAGDTVIAAIGAALAAGADVVDALQLATIAAGIVVSKLGASTASPREILEDLTQTHTAST